MFLIDASLYLCLKHTCSYFEYMQSFYVYIALISPIWGLLVIQRLIINYEKISTLLLGFFTIVGLTVDLNICTAIFYVHLTVMVWVVINPTWGYILYVYIETIRFLFGTHCAHIKHWAILRGTWQITLRSKGSATNPIIPIPFDIWICNCCIWQHTDEATF